MANPFGMAVLHGLHERFENSLCLGFGEECFFFENFIETGKGAVIHQEVGSFLVLIEVELIMFDDEWVVERYGVAECDAHVLHDFLVTGASYLDGE